MKREHLRPEQRFPLRDCQWRRSAERCPVGSHRLYYFREIDYTHIRELLEYGDTFAKAASMMTGTTISRHVVGSAWPQHFNK